MRLTTKIKHLLFKYEVKMDMPDEGLFVITLTDNGTGELNTFEADTWSSTVDQAYKFLKQEITVDHGQ